MATLTDLARLQLKLRELSLLVEDLLAQENVVPSPTPVPPPSPKPARVLPSSELLPLLTPVRPAQRSRADRDVSTCGNTSTPAETTLDSLEVDTASVGSSRSASSAMLKCENITFRVKATGPETQSTWPLFPSPSADTPSRGGVAAPVSPRRRLPFMTEQPLEPTAAVKGGPARAASARRVSW